MREFRQYSVVCFVALCFVSLLLLSKPVNAFFPRMGGGGEDLYAVLGIPRSASMKDIQKRFRVLARTEHPDHRNDPEEKETAKVKFQKITRAYEVLSDESKRSEYDQTGVVPGEGPPTGGGGGRHPFQNPFPFPFGSGGFHRPPPPPPMQWAQPSLDDANALFFAQYLSGLDVGLVTVVLTYSNYLRESQMMRPLWEEFGRSLELATLGTVKIRQLNTDTMRDVVPPLSVFALMGEEMETCTAFHPGLLYHGDTSRVVTSLRDWTIGLFDRIAAQSVQHVRDWTVLQALLASLATPRGQLVVLLTDTYRSVKDAEMLGMSMVLRSSRVVSLCIVLSPELMLEWLKEYKLPHSLLKSPHDAGGGGLQFAAMASVFVQEGLPTYRSSVLFPPQHRKLLLSSVTMMIHKLSATVTLTTLSAIRMEEGSGRSVSPLVGIANVESVCDKNCALLVLPTCERDSLGIRSPILSEASWRRAVDAFQELQYPDVKKGYLCADMHPELISNLFPRSGAAVSDDPPAMHLVIAPEGSDSRLLFTADYVFENGTPQSPHRGNRAPQDKSSQGDHSLNDHTLKIKLRQRMEEAVHEVFSRHRPAEPKVIARTFDVLAPLLVYLNRNAGTLSWSQRALKLGLKVRATLWDSMDLTSLLTLYIVVQVARKLYAAIAGGGAPRADAAAAAGPQNATNGARGVPLTADGFCASWELPYASDRDLDVLLCQPTQQGKSAAAGFVVLIFDTSLDKSLPMGTGSASRNNHNRPLPFVDDVRFTWRVVAPRSEAPKWWQWVDLHRMGTSAASAARRDRDDHDGTCFVAVRRKQRKADILASPSGIDNLRVWLLDLAEGSRTASVDIPHSSLP